MANMFRSIFWLLGGKTENTQDLFNAMGSMYVAVLFIGVQNASSVQLVVVVERTVFYREKAAGMYSTFPYAFAQALFKIRKSSNSKRSSSLREPSKISSPTRSKTFEALHPQNPANPKLFEPPKLFIPNPELVFGEEQGRGWLKWCWIRRMVM